jgi:transcriptional regulator with PAS, ATPase and Fis domain
MVKKMSHQHECDMAAVVLLIGLDEEKVAAVQKMLHGWSIETQVCIEPTFANDLVQGTRPMALFFVRVEELAEGVQTIERLRNQGIATIAGVEHLGQWTIGQRSLILASGASWLIDIEQPDWCHRLANCVVELHRKGRRQDEDKQRQIQLMQDLHVIGTSRGMQSVFQWAVRVGSLSDLPALITGETGTGKQVVAQAIHKLDPKRSKGPFVAVNCAAISLGVAEAELFGHRKGAYTGAERDRKGLIRSAQGGVLFLDEIGDLDYAIQGKLLRVLQDNRVLGVGEDDEVSVSVRIISATNRNLLQMVEQRTFREDLFHRLNMLSVTIPPIRERRDDIAPLVRYFLVKHKTLSRYLVQAVTDELIEALGKLDLTGNVRQLENIVCQIMINKENEQPLDLQDLPQALLVDLAHSQAKEPSTNATPSSIRDEDCKSEVARLVREKRWSLSRALQYCERFLVREALDMTKGNQAQAAQLLGVTPRSVYNLIRRHQLLHP